MSGKVVVAASGVDAGAIVKDVGVVVEAKVIVLTVGVVVSGILVVAA